MDIPSNGEVDPVARAIELQAEERSLQMLLQINAQEQQQLQQAPQTASPSITAQTNMLSHDPVTLLDADMSLEPMSPIDDGDDDTSADPSEDSDDDEHEADLMDRLEQQGQISAAHVLFPKQTHCEAGLPVDHLPNLSTEFTDLASYQAYNRAVRARNAALREITAVCYNEERNEIYTGNRSGKIHVWAH